MHLVMLFNERHVDADDLSKEESFLDLRRLARYGHNLLNQAAALKAYLAE